MAQPSEDDPFVGHLVKADREADEILSELRRSKLYSFLTLRSSKGSGTAIIMDFRAIPRLKPPYFEIQMCAEFLEDGSRGWWGIDPNWLTNTRQD